MSYHIAHGCSDAGNTCYIIATVLRVGHTFTEESDNKEAPASHFLSITNVVSHSSSNIVNRNKNIYYSYVLNKVLFHVTFCASSAKFTFRGWQT